MIEKMARPGGFEPPTHSLEEIGFFRDSNGLVGHSADIAQQRLTRSKAICNAAGTHATRFRHPEATPTETWIGNVYACDFPMIGWTTKRLGKVPYGSDGQRLRGGNMRPVLVKVAEIEATGVPIPATGPVDHWWQGKERGMAPDKYWSCEVCGLEYADPGIVPEQCPTCDAWSCPKGDAEIERILMMPDDDLLADALASGEDVHEAAVRLRRCSGRSRHDYISDTDDAPTQPERNRKGRM